LDDLQQKKLINNTLQESNRMNALCNNLLLSSQMEGNGYHFTSESINLSECVENCVSDFSSRFSNRNFEVEIEEKIIVQADAFLLQMAINNLIDNAVKYSPKDTSIKIQLEYYNQNCRLIVTDEGPGIPDEDKLKVFEKYYRIGTEATQKSKGTGLGLFLVNRIIKAHKAKIFIENNLPQGSRFIIEMKKLV
jgi:K+-sensing histidine kinase KdpD